MSRKRITLPRVIKRCFCLDRRPEAHAEAFWRTADKDETSTDGCWLWRGAVYKDGYGHLSIHGRQWKAHRLAYHLTGGPIPPGMQVCHRCDNPPCFNPAHLFLGTAAENMYDRTRKGRTQRGATHYAAILTEADVRAIRQATDVARVVAERYGVKRETISKIRRGVTWKHLG